MKRTAIILALTLVASYAIARECTKTTVITPSGEVLICTTCCDSKGNCTVHCL
jgi:hypothetical protein